MFDDLYKHILKENSAPEFVLVFNDGSSYKVGDTIPKCPFDKTNEPVTIKIIDFLSDEGEEVDENGISYNETRYAICLTYYLTPSCTPSCYYVSQITTEDKIEVFNYDSETPSAPLNFNIIEQSYINKQAYKDSDLIDMIDL